MKASGAARRTSLATARTWSYSSACMQEMPTIGGPLLRTHARADASVKTQVHDRRLVAVAPESRAHVLEPERFDPKERAQAEALVAGVRAHEENPHRSRIVDSPWDERKGEIARH